MTEILITEEVRHPAVDALAERYRVACDPELWRDRVALLARLGGVPAVIVRNMTRVDEEFLRAGDALRVVGRVGVGLDNLDLSALRERRIAVISPVEENAVSVAEQTFALLLALARKIPASDRCVRQGRWNRQEYVGFELAGKTLGLVGLGRVGFRVATRARAFGMRVVAYDPCRTPQHPFVTESGAELAELPALLQQADVISIHCPLSPETRGLIGAAQLQAAKPGAVLVNTARGPIVDEAALVAALRAGRLAGAGLDVREEEPPGDSPLHSLANVVLTPHVAGWTHEALDRVISAVAGDVDRVLSGRQPLNAV